MNITMILFGIIPLIAFVVIDSFFGLKSGLIAAVLFALAEAAYTIYEFGSLDALSIASLAMVLAFGLLSFKFNNAIYMKLQPVFLGICFGIIVLVLQVLNMPIMLLVIDKYGSMFPAEIISNFQNPYMRELLTRVSLTLGFGFIIHAALVAYAAFRLSNWHWLIIRGIGLYVIMALAVVAAQLL